MQEMEEGEGGQYRFYADTETTEAAMGALASSARTLSNAAGRSNPTAIENWRL